MNALLLQTHHVSGVPFLRGIDGDYSGWQKDHWKLKSVSAFNDGYALVDISFLDRYKVMPVDLQYKIDREGNYAGYTQKSVDAGLAILKSVTQMKNQLLKVFNPRDIKDPIQNLKKKYGVDFDLIGKKYRVYQYLIHQLSDDLKVQNVGGMNDFGTLGTIRDVYWWFKSLEDEFTSLTYSNVTLKDRVSVRKRTVNLTGYTIKDIDKLLEASVITADAAQAAKNFLNKRTEQYSGAFQQVWDYEYSANQAAKKQEKYNAAEIDDRRSTPPSGKIVSPTFGAYGYHEKPGVIRFTKTSDEVYYNISYSGKDFHDFRIVDTVGLTIKTRNFRTEAAMIQEIIRAYKEKYR